MTGQIINMGLDNCVFSFGKESGVELRFIYMYFFFLQSDVSIMYSELH